MIRQHNLRVRAMARAQFDAEDLARAAARNKPQQTP